MNVQRLQKRASSRKGLFGKRRARRALERLVRRAMAEESADTPAVRGLFALASSRTSVTWRAEDHLERVAVGQGPQGAAVRMLFEFAAAPADVYAQGTAVNLLVRLARKNPQVELRLVPALIALAGTPAREHLDVLTALGHFASTARVLLQGAGGTDREHADSCARILRRLPPGNARTALRRHSLDGNALAEQIIREEGWFREENAKDAVALFFAGSWERYTRLDPDGSALLRACEEGGIDFYEPRLSELRKRRFDPRHAAANSTWDRALMPDPDTQPPDHILDLLASLDSLLARQWAARRRPPTTPAGSGTPFGPSDGPRYPGRSRSGSPTGRRKGRRDWDIDIGGGSEDDDQGSG